MNIMNPKVDDFLSKVKKWLPELEMLRSIALSCLLTEELKWKQPCYTYQDSNILLLGQFKDYCALSFFKGVLLQDANKLLQSPGENSQSVKMFKFTTLEQIVELESTIKAYIFEAIEIEKAGLKVTAKSNDKLIFPQEFQEIMSKDKAYNDAFFALTPGRQRAYHIFFTSAKQPKTIISRIESYRDRILKGFGFNDCTCGMSKRMPNCDGSHKYI